MVALRYSWYYEYSSCVTPGHIYSHVARQLPPLHFTYNLMMQRTKTS